MSKIDESLRGISYSCGADPHQRTMLSCGGEGTAQLSQFGRLGNNMVTLHLFLIILFGSAVLVFTVGCQERVVSRTGIGADETNPRVSEPAGDDRLSNYIWDDKKKK